MTPSTLFPVALYGSAREGLNKKVRSESKPKRDETARRTRPQLGKGWNAATTQTESEEFFPGDSAQPPGVQPG
jgi:hypothetical protein